MTSIIQRHHERRPGKLYGKSGWECGCVTSMHHVTSGDHVTHRNHVTWGLHITPIRNARDIEIFGLVSVCIRCSRDTVVSRWAAGQQVTIDPTSGA